MRYRLVETKPTKKQLVDIKASMLDGSVIGQSGKYFIVYDDKQYSEPTWLVGKPDINVPAEPHRCSNCGELI